MNHLKNLKAHIGNSEVDLGAFTVCCWVETDTIQFQFTSNLQNLKIRFSWSLTPATDDINVYICISFTLKRIPVMLLFS